MVYNEYRTYILTCEYLNREPSGDYRKVHDFITGLWDGMDVVVDSRSNQMVLEKGGEWFIEMGVKNVYVWCHYERVWSFFQKDMGMEVTERQDFVKSVVEEHLGCQVGTPFLKCMEDGL